MTKTINLNVNNMQTSVTKTLDGYHIEAHYNGTFVNRPELAAWGVGPKHATLARRLKNALDAGVVFSSATLCTDVNGKTYLSPVWKFFLLGRTLNADLRRLGF